MTEAFGGHRPTAADRSIRLASRSPASRLKRAGDRSKRGGVTLIELVITISILAVLAVIVIPTVRFVSKERQAREAARVVNATFASAQAQAVADGLSGVWIERNPNVQAGNASTRIFQVRAPRPFTGYGVNSKAFVDPPSGPTHTIHVPARALMDGGLPAEDSMFQLNDFIQINHRGPLYRVIEVSDVSSQGPNFSRLTFMRSAIEPPPPEGWVPFKIFRRPVIVPSTATELPRGYMIDLSVSGHGSTGFQFFNPTASLPDPDSSEIVIIFNNNGEVDAIYPNGLNDVPVNQADFLERLVPNGTLYLMIAEIEVENSAPATIFNQRNLWVTVNRHSGQSSVANMGDPTVGGDNPLENARSISRTGVGANQ